MKFLFFSEFGETLDLAIHLEKVCGHEVLFHTHDHASKSIGRGIVHQIDEWYKFLGDGYTWVFDSCAFGPLQDWLRSKGEAVFGGCSAGDKLENDRQLNQEWFREAGFSQPTSKNFTTVDSALKFVEKHSDQRWVLKQNGEAPKSINHVGEFENSEDMIHHLRELQRSWNESAYGKFDCDLMEFVEGMEVAVSVFFNGTDYMKNNTGSVVGFINFEEKKETDGGLGETCGEMGTTFIGVTEDHPLFRRIIMREALVDKLRKIGFHGVFDVNCIVTDRKIVALEPTMRFGVPATSYEFCEGMRSDPGELIDSCARGTNQGIDIHYDVGMVMCVVAKPFPLEVDVEDSGTSIGERLWILGSHGQPTHEFSEEQLQHIHLYNFERASDEATGEFAYKVATKTGYLLTVTGRGTTVKTTRRALIGYIRDNIYISGMKYRHDIGERVELYEDDLLGA